MPIGSYLTALIKAKRARLNRSSIHSILQALDIEDGCRQDTMTKSLAIVYYLSKEISTKTKFGSGNTLTEKVARFWIKFIAISSRGGLVVEHVD